MTDQRNGEQTQVNAKIEARLGSRATRLLLVSVLGGGTVGGVVGFLHNGGGHPCYAQESELVQWQRWAEDRSYQYPMPDNPNFWTGLPVDIDTLRATR